MTKRCVNWWQKFFPFYAIALAKWLHFGRPELYLFWTIIFYITRLFGSIYLSPWVLFVSKNHFWIWITISSFKSTAHGRWNVSGHTLTSTRAETMTNTLMVTPMSIVPYKNVQLVFCASSTYLTPQYHHSEFWLSTNIDTRLYTVFPGFHLRYGWPFLLLSGSLYSSNAALLTPELWSLRYQIQMKLQEVKGKLFYHHKFAVIAEKLDLISFQPPPSSIQHNGFIKTVWYT